MSARVSDALPAQERAYKTTTPLLTGLAQEVVEELNPTDESPTDRPTVDYRVRQEPKITKNKGLEFVFIAERKRRFFGWRSLDRKKHGTKEKAIAVIENDKRLLRIKKNPVVFEESV